MSKYKTAQINYLKGWALVAQKSNNISMLMLSITFGILSIIFDRKLKLVNTLVLLSFLITLVFLINKPTLRAKFIKRILYYSTLSYFLILCAGCAFAFSYDGQYLFVVISIVLDRIVWISIYYLTKKKERKFGYRTPNAANTSSIGIFAAFGVIGVSVASVLLNGISNEHAIALLSYGLLILPCIFSLCGSTFVPLILILKNPELESHISGETNVSGD